MEIAFFPKIARWLRASPPEPPESPTAGGSATKPPSLIRSSYNSLLNTSLNLDILTFGKPGNGVLSSILRYHCSTKRSSYENL